MLSLSRFPGHIQSAGEYPVTRCHGKTRSTDVQRAEAGGHSFTQISRELGIHSSLLQVWRKKYASTEVSSEKSVSSESVEAELRRLRRENASLKEDREILKKAAAFFAKESRRNTRSSRSKGRTIACIGCAEIWKYQSPVFTNGAIGR